MTTVNDCRHCTVPTEGDACNFCKSYTPPAQTSPHTIVRLDSSTAWRDLAGELTDHQRAQIESTEAHYRELGLDGPQARRDLLAYTIEYVNGNRIDADHAHVAVPEGATLASGDGWERDRDFNYSRSLGWREFETGVDEIALDISGRQSTDGSFTRSIQLYTDTVELNAVEARRLAAALLEAANEMDRLSPPDVDTSRVW